MRVGAAISVVFHTALVTLLFVFAGVDPFKPTPAEAITVDIVPEKQAPKKPQLDIPDFDFTKKEGGKDSQDADSKSADKKSDDKPAETKPAETKPADKPAQKAADTKQPDKAQQKAPDTKPEKTASAQQQMQQQLQQQQQMQQPPPSVQPDLPPPGAQPSSDPQSAPMPYADLSQKFTSLTGADNSNFDAPATQAADVTLDAIGALRKKIRECSTLPKSVAPDDAIEFVLRISLRRDGTLASEPDLFKIVKPTENGAALTVSAKKALFACQPYTMLPADKYNEWKTLDLGFTTRDFKGG